MLQETMQRAIGAAADVHEPGDNTRLAVLQEGAVLDEMSMPDGELRFASCGTLSELEAAVSRAASDLGSSSRGP